MKPHFLSMRLDWKTPKAFYAELDKEFHFDFDPCPVGPTFDGLSIEWGKVNYVNPHMGGRYRSGLRRGGRSIRRERLSFSLSLRELIRDGFKTIV